MKTNTQKNTVKTEFQKRLEKLKKKERIAFLVGILSLFLFAAIVWFTVGNNKLRNEEMEEMRKQIDTLNSQLVQRDSTLKNLQSKTIELLDSIAKVVTNRDQLEKANHYQNKAIEILKNPDAIIAKSENWRGNIGTIKFENISVVLNGKGVVSLRAAAQGRGSDNNARMLIEFFDENGKEIYSSLQVFNMKPISVFSAKSNITQYFNREFRVNSDKYLNITTIKISAN